MANNFLHSGETLTYVNAGGTTISSGAVVVLGARLAIALDRIAPGEQKTVRVKGVFVLAKLATDDVAQGAAVYWDAANARLTLDSAGGKVAAGYAAEPSGPGATTLAVALNG